MTALQLPSGYQTSAKFLPLFDLSSNHRPFAFSQSRNDVFPLFDNGFELFRIGGDRVVPPFQILIESEMFLDHAGAKCDGSEWNRGSQGVIAKAYGYTEGLL